MKSQLPDVLESCARVMRAARHARIDDAALEARARTIDAARLIVPEPPEALRFRGDARAAANFTLLCDALNFCFWSDQPWVISYAGESWTRTFAMLAGVHRAVAGDARWLLAARWRDASEADVRRLFEGRGEIPLVEERASVLRETGERLIAHYSGQFGNLVESAGYDAATVAQLLARDFPSFRDIAEHGGQPVAFLKRAQICAADLAAAWHGVPADAVTGKMPVAQGLERLTVFADYRLPQLFRHWGVLRLAPDLEARIEARQIIPTGSEEEVEIRAATVVIGERLSRAAGAPPWKLDYFLWDASHAPEVRVEHHRTPTIFY